MLIIFYNYICSFFDIMHTRKRNSCWFQFLFGLIPSLPTHSLTHKNLDRRSLTFLFCSSSSPSLLHKGVGPDIFRLFFSNRIFRSVERRKMRHKLDKLIERTMLCKCICTESDRSRYSSRDSTETHQNHLEYKLQ